MWLWSFPGVIKSHLVVVLKGFINGFGHSWSWKINVKLRESWFCILLYLRASKILIKISKITYSSYIYIFCLQEILDQIADIDLVVNFKCVEDSLVKKDFGSRICSHCGKLFDASNSESTSLNPCLATRTRHSLLKPSSAISKEGSHMEKFCSYAEQVL